MLLHRIALAQYAGTSLDAFGGRGGLYGKGRWHTPGRLIVYTATHASLAMAESLVHLQRSSNIAPYSRWEIAVPDTHIAPAPKLPRGWEKNLSITQKLGDAWLSSGSSVALLVPSAIIPQENNCLLNPAHPDFDLAWISAGPLPFNFDPRLVKGNTPELR